MTIAPTTATARQYELNASIAPNLEHGAMRFSFSQSREPFQAKREQNSSRVSTADIIDFVQEQARRRRTKEVMALTGLGEKQVEALRLGRCGASSQTISTWCRNDPDFRAAYFRFCGGELEVSPETVAALTKAINHVMRREGA